MYPTTYTYSVYAKLYRYSRDIWRFHCHHLNFFCPGIVTVYLFFIRHLFLICCMKTCSDKLGHIFNMQQIHPSFIIQACGMSWSYMWFHVSGNTRLDSVNSRIIQLSMGIITVGYANWIRFHCHVILLDFGK